MFSDRLIGQLSDVVNNQSSVGMFSLTRILQTTCISILSLTIVIHIVSTVLCTHPMIQPNTGLQYPTIQYQYHVGTVMLQYELSSPLPMSLSCYARLYSVDCKS